jgi:Family of unknown function (DUF6325)
VALGPVEYLIVGFPGNKFTGEIAPALAELVDSGIINVIDLVFITKDADGTVASFEFDALEELADFAGIEGEVGGLVTEEDIAYAAQALEPNSSAAMLVWENAWATNFAEALRGADAVILEGGRIPHDLIEAAFAELAAAAG